MKQLYRSATSRYLIKTFTPLTETIHRWHVARCLVQMKVKGNTRGSLLPYHIQTELCTLLLVLLFVNVYNLLEAKPTPNYPVQNYTISHPVTLSKNKAPVKKGLRKTLDVTFTLGLISSLTASHTTQSLDRSHIECGQAHHANLREDAQFHQGIGLTISWILLEQQDPLLHARMNQPSQPLPFPVLCWPQEDNPNVFLLLSSPLEDGWALMLWEALNEWWYFFAAPA